jgi:hypothetical protein
VGVSLSRKCDQCAASGPTVSRLLPTIGGESDSSFEASIPGEALGFVGEVYSVIQQSDGKILVGGEAVGNWAVLRHGWARNVVPLSGSDKRFQGIDSCSGASPASPIFHFAFCVWRIKNDR